MMIAPSPGFTGSGRSIFVRPEDAVQKGVQTVDQNRLPKRQLPTPHGPNGQRDRQADEHQQQQPDGHGYCCGMRDIGIGLGAQGPGIIGDAQALVRSTDSSRAIGLFFAAHAIIIELAAATATQRAAALSSSSPLSPAP